MVSTDPASEPATEPSIEVCRRTVRGLLDVITEPGNLRARVTIDGQPPLELRLPGETLQRALLFDGEDARVSYLETSVEGRTIDCTVSVVIRGEPTTGAELIAALDAITEDMTQEEREALADALDPKWRDDGGPEWRTSGNLD